MFGYIRPMQTELKVREFERFKACYCGLCNALGKKYGVAARFVLNYELVFLAMLLWDQKTEPEIKRSRCIASPCRKKCFCARSEALDICAGYNVILTWWKLRDSISDEPFIRALPQRLLSLFLFRAYRSAARDFPGFNAKVEEEVKALAGYESQFLSSQRDGSNSDIKHDKSSDLRLSLDGAADKFAKILRSAVPETLEEKKRRPLLELLYHLGRWIYLADACDDYRDDIKQGRFNAVVLRFPSGDGSIPDDGVSRLKTTLAHSNNLLCSAFELLPANAWSDIVRNIIYLSMPDVCDRVLKGDYEIGRRYHP